MVSQGSGYSEIVVKLYNNCGSEIVVSKYILETRIEIGWLNGESEILLRLQNVIVLKVWFIESGNI